MFRDIINYPISPIPNEYISQILRPTREPDYSLTCLSIAMLRRRIENYQGISGIYSYVDTKAAAMDDFVNRFKTIDNVPSFCYYIYARNNVEEVPAELKEFKEKVQVSSFIKDKTSNECQILYHEEKNIVGIFVNTKDIKIYHLLLSFISLYYPNLFKASPMTDVDYAIVKTLSKSDKSCFCAEIKYAVKEYETEFRHMQLSTLLVQLHEGRIKQAEESVSRQRSEVSSLERRYSEAIVLLKDLIMTYEGIKATENYDDAEKDLVEYLTENKSVHNLNIKDNAIYFDVTTTLTNYNEHVWEIFSDRGHIYDGQYRTDLPEAFKSRTSRKLLFDNIFSADPKLVVKMCGNYRLNMRDCRVYTSGSYDYVGIDPMYKSYIPNPHLKLFECLGGYKDKVMHELMEKNLVGAIELCIASAGSINLEETDQNFRPFLGWLLTSKEKVLMTKDGVEMTPEEALLWLHEEVKE